MTVIAITAVLAAVDIPVYKDYKIKTMIANYFHLLENWQRDLLIVHQTSGSFPTTASFLGSNITQNTQFFLPSNSLNLDAVCYRAWPSLVYVHFEINPAALGLPSESIYTIRSDAYINSNGIISTHCGTWSIGNVNEINEVPIKYLPSNCSCRNMQASHDTGVPTC